jgi:hypothetical protein
MLDPSPAKRAYVTVADITYELVATEKLTFPESRELKRVSGGMSLAEAEKGINSLDTDAWFAWMFVSIKREWPTLTTDELESAIGETPILAVIKSVTQEVPEVANQDPPEPPPESVPLEQTNGSDSGEKTPQLSTPGPVGLRT